METLLPIAERIAKKLIARKETVAVVESSAGGLVAAALLSVGGASAYFKGGAVSYTYDARQAFLGISQADLGDIRSSSEPYAALVAARVRDKLGATWGLAEGGAAGPSGNRYGDPPGHGCIAVDGPMHRVLTVETGSADRVANMRAFARAALEAFEAALDR
jgi:PncC family amidohydrolase